jgi:hypothetical protein
MKPRRIVCAAIRAADGSVLLGIRHYSKDMHEQIAARTDGEKFKHRHGDDQGFVDNHGVYLTREDAYFVALGQEQIMDFSSCRTIDKPQLYSEGLY